MEVRLIVAEPDCPESKDAFKVLAEIEKSTTDTVMLSVCEISPLVATIVKV